MIETTAPRQFAFYTELQHVTGTCMCLHKITHDSHGRRQLQVEDPS